jgi:rRNA maturation endonuclease Nob1
MSLANNPLKQYFRRPSIYLKLPSGGAGYPPGALNRTETGELPIYPMTAIDEITSKTPDALFNGSAIVEIIKSCVPDIKDPWSIPSTDLDAILIAIRSAAQGNDMEIESECPSCKEIATYAINLIGMLQTMKPGDYTKELQISDLFIKFRPLMYREMNQAAMAQFEIQKMFSTIETLPEEERTKKTQEAIVKITEVTMAVLAQTIEYVKTPTVTVNETEFILDFLQNCDKNLYIELRDYHSKLKDSTQIKPQKIKCIHCQHEYEQGIVINATDFFG